MSVNRKEFLILTASGVASMVSAPRRLFAEAGDQAQSFYSADMFKPYVGQTFRITSAEKDTRMDPLDVTLQTVTDVAGGPQTVQFSLVFVGPAGDAIPSKTYLFLHPQLGSLPIFVGPARKDGEGRTLYRADFNILQNERSTVVAPPRRKR
jgi:hypothetical protein